MEKEEQIPPHVINFSVKSSDNTEQQKTIEKEIAEQQKTIEHKNQGNNKNQRTTKNRKTKKK